MKYEITQHLVQHSVFFTYQFVNLAQIIKNSITEMSFLEQYKMCQGKRKSSRGKKKKKVLVFVFFTKFHYFSLSLGGKSKFSNLAATSQSFHCSHSVPFPTLMHVVSPFSTILQFPFVTLLTVEKNPFQIMRNNQQSYKYPSLPLS